MVDFPEPFSPIIKVVDDLSKKTIVGLSPVERKFLQEIFLNIIIQFRLEVVVWGHVQIYILHLRFLVSIYQYTFDSM